MAIESVTSKIQGQQILEQGVNLQSSDVKTSKPETPILGGVSVKVVDGSTTDLEKLVAMLKNENEATRQSVAERRTAILSTVLDSMAERISAAEKENILKLEQLTTEKSEATAQLNGLNKDQAVMEALIKSLDDRIKQAVQDGEDHRELVEKLKAQRAEEQAKLDGVKQSIKSVSSKIAGLDAKIAECSKAIAASTLTEVYAALRAATGDDKPTAEKTETQAERDRQEAKNVAFDIALHLSAALDKLDGQIRAALDEAQMKVEG